MLTLCRKLNIPHSISYQNKPRINPKRRACLSLNIAALDA
jgi:hypothetical protein